VVRTFRRNGRLRNLSIICISLFFVCLGCNRTNPLPVRADKIVISKSAHTLTLLNHGEAVRIYKIAIGRHPLGPKNRAGDHKTPEGSYVIDGKKNQSRFHLALHLSYPNQVDRELAQKANVNPGSDIEIHGLENGLGWIGSLQREIDWTDGCIAVTNPEIEEIWNAVAVGTPVDIRP